ncbi:MAG: Cu+-exporting ATPase [Lentimonas sp.]
MLNQPESLSRGGPVVCTTADQACDAMDLQLSGSWLRIGVAAVFAGQGMVFSLALNMTPPPFASVPYWVLHGGLIFSALAVLAFLGGPLLRSTFGMLCARRLSIEGLFTLSLLGAFFGSLVSSLTGTGAVFYEVVSIVIGIYTAGRMLGERSQAKLSLESERLRERYDTAQVVDAAGHVCAQAVGAVAVGARVRVDVGAPFTVDGILTSGVGYVRETALTGEPLPVVRRVGDFVRAGTWSMDGAFELRAERVGGARELDRILQTVEDAGGRPSELQTQANGLIQLFLPTVALVSVLTALYWAWAGTWTEAVFHSMAVLLVACPCALGLATPVAIWQGLYNLARMGLVSRDGALIDALARTQQLFFDKTGTLSESSMRVAERVVAEGLSVGREALLAAIVAVESRMVHPVAQALIDAIDVRASEAIELEHWRLLPGQGVEARVRWQGTFYRLQVGEVDLVAASFQEQLEALSAQLLETGGKRCYALLDGLPVAIFVLRERARDGVAAVWERLQQMGIRATVLTGDPAPQFSLPGQVGIQAGLSAQDKARIVHAAQADGVTPIFVGDGVNDAAAMAAASAAIAMGSGAALTRSAASGQLTADQVSILPDAIELARSICQRLRLNLRYAACYNLLGMAFAAAGLLHPVAAALIMLVSSFMVTALALRGGHGHNSS